MYEDTWYSFVPDVKSQKEEIQLPKSAHRRRESLLKQPNEGDRGVPSQPISLDSLFEESSAVKGPPEATVARRAKSYSDFYHVARAQLTKDAKKSKQEYREEWIDIGPKNCSLDFETHYETLEDDLLGASQEEFQLYRDQLALTERHLDGLLNDTESALTLLARLSDSFRSVKAETTAFQGQCEDLLAEQKHLRSLADEVETHLKYYTYLEPITRRLNAPGASSMIGDDGFIEMLTNLDACIRFMINHPQHREAEVYLTRYKSLHERTLNLIRIKFSKLVQGDKEKSKRNASSSKTLTITDIFLYLAPDSVGDAALLQNTMDYLRLETDQELLLERIINAKTTNESQWLYDQAKELYDIDLKDIKLQDYRDHIAKYAETFEHLIKDWVDTRYDLIPNLLERVLNGFGSELSATEYSHTYAHEVVNSVLEICAFENTRFVRIFWGPKHSRQKNQREGAFQMLESKANSFKTFLGQLCITSFNKLSPRLNGLELTQEVDLAVWLKGKNDNHSTHIEDSDDENSEEPDDKNEEAYDGKIKRFVVAQLTSLVTRHVFERMGSIAFTDIKEYAPKKDDIEPHSTAQPQSEESSNQITTTDGVSAAPRDNVRARANTLLGAGLWNAYPAVISAAQLFILFNDLYYDGQMDDNSNEMAYKIIHDTCEAIKRAGTQIYTRYSSIDSLIFSIKNLVLLKNVVLALEISGSHRASILDFSSIWDTFSDLRSRGGLLDMRSYYHMLTNGTLLPRVVESVQDARTELDGLLRQTITKFREECAAKLWNRARKSPEKDHWVVKDNILAKLKVMFPMEDQLQASLWQAVEDLVEAWKAEA